MSIYVGTVNNLSHWLRIPFDARFWIPLRGLSGFRRTGLRILFRMLYSFWIPLGLLVPSNPHLVLVHCYFEFSMIFLLLNILAALFFGARLGGVLWHNQLLFISICPNFVKMVLSYPASDPIKSHVYCFGSFSSSRSVYNTACWCIVRCHQCLWFLVAHFW